MRSALPMKLRIRASKKTALEVSSDVRSIWHRYRQTGFKNEACGILIGGYDISKTKVFIDFCTSPKKMDKRSRCAFVLRDPFHQTHLEHVFEQADAESFYMGTWHSHPEKSPTPSHLDLCDWGKCMKRNSQNKLFVFVIVGTAEILLAIFRRGEKWRDLHEVT